MSRESILNNISYSSQSGFIIVENIKLYIVEAIGAKMGPKLLVRGCGSYWQL